MFLNAKRLTRNPEFVLAFSQEFFFGPTRGAPGLTHVVLWNLAELCQPKKYGEIGSHKGFSACTVAKASGNSTDIYCYDAPNHDYGGIQNSDFYLEYNLHHFAPNKHKIVYGNSALLSVQQQVINNGPYDIFLIDGDHSLHGVIVDIKTVLDNRGSHPLILIIDDIYHRSHFRELQAACYKMIQIYKPKNHFFVHQHLLNNTIFSTGVGVFIFE